MLRTFPGHAWDVAHFPPLVGWADPSMVTPLQYLTAARAFCDVGIGERPIGSNRSGRIDAYLRRAGVPETVIAAGSGYWCAAWAGAVWRDAAIACGLASEAASVPQVVPNGYAGCDAWRPWARKRRRWLEPGELRALRSDRQRARLLGATALYGTDADQSHIGVIVRADSDYLLNVEGNTAMNGYSRNGTLCDLKDVPMARLVGVALLPG